MIALRAESPLRQGWWWAALGCAVLFGGLLVLWAVTLWCVFDVSDTDWEAVLVMRTDDFWMLIHCYGLRFWS